MRLPEYCATHTFKEFLEMTYEITVNRIEPDRVNPAPVTSAVITSTEFPRAKKHGWDVTTLDHERHRTLQEQDVEGKCHALWLLNGNETQEWNGDGCDCEWVQGNLNCKLNPF